MTNNLGVTQVTAAQNDKETTINNGFAAIDAAITDELSIDIDNSNAATITEAQLQQNVSFLLADDGADAAVTITVDGTNARGLFIVKNRCTQTATVEISGQSETSPTVSDGDDILLYDDGSDVVQVLTGAIDTTARAKTNVLWERQDFTLTSGVLALGSRTGDYGDLTFDSNDLTSVTGLTAGEVQTLVAQDAGVIEYDAGVVETQTADDLVVAAGDVIKLFPIGTNQVRVEQVRADGYPVSYEEGTWTPAVSFATPGDLSVAYVYQVGSYTRNGRIGNIVGRVATSSLTYGTASGVLRLTGLPLVCDLANNNIMAAWGVTGPTLGTAATECTGIFPNATTSVSYLDWWSVLRTLATGIVGGLFQITTTHVPTGRNVGFTGSITMRVVA